MSPTEEASSPPQKPVSSSCFLIFKSTCIIRIVEHTEDKHLGLSPAEPPDVQFSIQLTCTLIKKIQALTDITDLVGQNVIFLSN